MEIYDAIAEFISKMGFPIFVATFLLLRVDKTLKDILVLLSEITTAMRVLARLQDEADDEDEDEDEEPTGTGEEDVA